MPQKGSEVIDLTLHDHPPGTSKAILVSDDGNREKAVWLPLSQIEVDRESLKAPAIIVTMPTWLAVDKGLV